MRYGLTEQFRLICIQLNFIMLLTIFLFDEILRNFRSFNIKHATHYVGCIMIFVCNAKKLKPKEEELDGTLDRIKQM